MHELDDPVRDSLEQFVDWIARHRWYGREHEAVSLYAFGFLQRQCRPDSVLADPMQIGIEAAVLQLPGSDRKRLVCKDLIIWACPGMTCWNDDRQPVHRPLCIMEWKRFQDRRRARHDREWLQEFSKHAADFVGYSVVLGLGEMEERLRCARATANGIDENWLVL